MTGLSILLAVVLLSVVIYFSAFLFRGNYNNDDIKKLVEKLDDESRSKIDNRSLSLNEIIYLIPQHIQR